MVLRLLENTFVSQKIESVHFDACSQANLSLRFLSSPLQAEGNYSFSPSRDGEDYGAENMTKN